MNFFQARAVDVRVDLGRGDIRVSQHQLHRAEIGAALDQMSGKRMAQRVRRHFFFNTRGQGMAANELPEALA